MKKLIVEQRVWPLELRQDGESDAYELRGYACLLYTSDAADDLLCVDLGGRRIIKKKKCR